MPRRDSDFLRALERLCCRVSARVRACSTLCCGTGRVAAELTARGLSVTGLDISEEMLAYARRNAPAAEFVAADARAFALPPPFDAAISTFDRVNTSSVWESWPRFRKRPALARAGRRLLLRRESGDGLPRALAGALLGSRLGGAVRLVRATTRGGAARRYDFTLFAGAKAAGTGVISPFGAVLTKSELRESLGRAGFCRLKFFDAPTAAGLPSTGAASSSSPSEGD